MFYISHRGNLDGKNISTENTVQYIDNALKLNFDVEIDVWLINNIIFLGHDHPENKISLSYLLDRSENLWIHTKNIEALVFLKNYNSINCFWHQTDDVTLTTKGYIWAYPGKQPIKNSIAVMPEIYNDKLDTCIGVCSDLIVNYKNIVI